MGNKPWRAKEFRIVGDIEKGSSQSTEVVHPPKQETRTTKKTIWLKRAQRKEHVRDSKRDRFQKQNTEILFSCA